MTARNEKPSATESSTDTIIGALEIIANMLEYVDLGIEATAVREAASRLDKLERELETLRDANQVFKYEHVAWIHDITHVDGDTDTALSFSESEFPFSDVTGYRSIACAPLYKLRLNTNKV
jgi:hypothetical protein